MRGQLEAGLHLPNLQSDVNAARTSTSNGGDRHAHRQRTWPLRREVGAPRRCALHLCGWKNPILGFRIERINTSPRAIAVRGTTDQIAATERLLAEFDPADFPKGQ